VWVFLEPQTLLLLWATASALTPLATAQSQQEDSKASPSLKVMSIQGTPTITNNHRTLIYPRKLKKNDTQQPEW
jgi:hypothetical protein